MPLLHWLTRDADLKLSSNAPYRLLEHVPALSFGAADTENMLIQGDNLDALKTLLPFYAGRVKCIFIDPPYNTRSAFEHYDDNLEHAKWLAMMYPRLELLRELLSEDGSIWVSIDDNEGHSRPRATPPTAAPRARTAARTSSPVPGRWVSVRRACASK